MRSVILLYKRILMYVYMWLALRGDELYNDDVYDA